MTTGLLLGWVALIALGAAVYIGITGRPRHGDWLSVAGHAPLLGVLACGIAIALVPDATGAQLPGLLGWGLGIALLAAGGVAAWRWRQGAPAIPQTDWRMPWWAWCLVGLLALRFILIIDEAWLRPQFPWDAWQAWAPKAKTWFVTGQSAAYVGPEAWWNDAEGSLRSSQSWRYPELLSRIEFSLAGLAGAWNEAAVGTLWPVWWLGLLLAFAGQWRALGVPPVAIGVATYVLGSLPLLDTHAALAGYADLPLAALLGCSVLAWQRWMEHRDRGQLILAIGLLVLLPMLKFEGAVWALGFAATMALAAVPPRMRWFGMASVVLMVAAAVAVSLLVEVPWLATLRSILSGEAGSHPDVERLAALRAVLSGLFLQENWHLLWAALLGVVVVRWRALSERPAVAWTALYLAGAVVAVLGLFLLTPAGKWAQSNTAVNRLFLQLVPVAVSLGVLLLRDVFTAPAPGDTRPASAAPPPAA
ncbi:hypothetical protein [Tahibacter amnicola]|uniref:Dolichyl-phosphate-mannose-protein mannosyltransferase n=1 Tax=Tahibacter amnicola TaxID=2976241 RepID=A0ABY6BBN6_9GAMM|nr:hypothetical protein [Tahibacter amnicola]MCU7375989.1 hypothetical protein [Paucibacter sp. O1-1]MDA3831001.1 hypothetical protein [Paucibacter sp. O1-1]UXI66952.1 hypothetical protein N4264_19675 [Tahibacter amnicola]